MNKTRPTTADATTVSVFQDTWDIYRKMVENNYLFHREAYAALHDVLVSEVDRPFRFLDIACGDASSSAIALRGTKISHYRGVDFSSVALDLARKAIAPLGIPAEFEECDFLEALAGRTDIADVMWIGLSLHHLQRPAKLDYMREVRGALAKDGLFLVFENTSPDGETRAQWMDRSDVQAMSWTAYTPDEWASMRDHYHSADFPETESSWHELGHEAGFSTVREIYRTPSDLYRVYGFAA
jgi:SAM-dependent methyltransferase